MTITVGSLFSGGIDGMAIAFSLAGADVRWHAEIDEFNRRLLNKHARLWPNADSFADVRHVGRHNLRPVDIIVGGFPCQDVSTAGKRAGMGEGTRSGLWSEFRRIVEELQPRMVAIENVPGLLAPIKRKKLAIRRGYSSFVHAPAARTKVYAPPAFEVARQLAEMGYVGSYGVISAADAGAPHLRERVFMVGYAVRQRRQEPRAIENSGYDQKRHISTRRKERPAKLHALVADGEADGVEHAVSFGRKTRKNQPDQRKARHASGRFCKTVSNQARSGKRANQPRLGGYPDGFTPRLDGFRGYPAAPGQTPAPFEPSCLVTQSPPLITKRIAALGNAIHWPTFYPIAYYAMKFLTGGMKAEEMVA